MTPRGVLLSPFEETWRLLCVCIQTWLACEDCGRRGKWTAARRQVQGVLLSLCYFIGFTGQCTKKQNNNNRSVSFSIYTRLWRLKTSNYASKIAFLFPRHLRKNYIKKSDTLWIYVWIINLFFFCFLFFFKLTSIFQSPFSVLDPQVLCDQEKVLTLLNNNHTTPSQMIGPPHKKKDALKRKMKRSIAWFLHFYVKKLSVLFQEIVRSFVRWCCLESSALLLLLLSSSSQKNHRCEEKDNLRVTSVLKWLEILIINFVRFANEEGF